MVDISLSPFKFVQCLSCLIALFLFLCPYELSVSSFATSPEGKGISRWMTLNSLVCRVHVGQEIGKAEVEKNLSLPADVQLESDSHLLNVGRCLMENNEDECICMKDYLMISTVVATGFLSLCCGIIFAVYYLKKHPKTDDSDIHIRIYWVCLSVSALTSFISMVWFAMVLHQLTHRWPFSYSRKVKDVVDGTKDELTHYYRVPPTWYVAVGFCFLFTVMLSFETLVYAERLRKHQRVKQKTDSY